jgi:hypothetical protein
MQRWILTGQGNVSSSPVWCSPIGSPDKNDRITDCASQSQVVPALQQTVAPVA